MKRVLFVTWDRYPNGDAGAVRTHALAKVFMNLGYEVFVAGMGETTRMKFKDEDAVAYMSFRFSSNDLISRIRGRLEFHKHLKKFFFSKENHWDAIVVVSVPNKTLKFLKRCTHRYTIPLLHDSVEWYSPEQFSLGRFHLAYIAKDRWNRKHIDKSVRVIAISTYLEKYFKEKGLLTTRIPVVMDMDRISYKKNIDIQKTVYLYAGSPGRKDYLNVVVDAFADMPITASYELRIIGVTKEQLITQCNVTPSVIEKLGDKLCCMGRIDRLRVLDELSKADFTVLMRSQEQRYAKAGFPTKFVESLATATPVIANLTSDLDMYLTDGENGFVVDNSSSEALARVLKYTCELSLEQRIQLQRNARKTAEKYFDYAEYMDQIKKLITVPV